MNEPFAANGGEFGSESDWPNRPFWAKTVAREKERQNLRFNDKVVGDGQTVIHTSALCNEGCGGRELRRWRPWPGFSHYDRWAKMKENLRICVIDSLNMEIRMGDLSEIAGRKIAIFHFFGKNSHV